MKSFACWYRAAVVVVQVLAVSLAASTSSPNAEAGYIFTRIVDTNTPIPGGQGTFTSFSLGIDSFDGVDVAFRGAGSNDQAGIYTAIGGSVELVADKRTVVPGTSDTFDGLGVPAISNGRVAFDGGRQGPIGFKKGIYTNLSGSLESVVDQDSVFPEIPGGRAGSIGAPLLDGNHLVFTANVGSQVRIFSSSSSPPAIAVDGSTVLPDGATYTSIHPPVGVDGPNIIFDGVKDGEWGLYSTQIGGQPQVVVSPSVPNPAGVGALNYQGTRAVFRDGQVVFSAADDQQIVGLYADFGNGLEVVFRHAERGQDIGRIAYQSGQLAYLSDDDPAFFGRSEVLYAQVPGRTRQRIIGAGDPLAGSIVTEFGLGQNHIGVDGAGQIGFIAELSNGSMGIYKATPFNPPAPGTRVEQSLLPPLNPDPNLVLIVHGWRGSADDAWVVEMQNAIESKLFSTPGIDPALWQVRAYDWRDLASADILVGDIPDPRTAKRALRNGVTLGDIEGPILADQHFEHVHLISHSAGAGFIDEVTRWITSLSPSTAVQQTFLDPFVIGANWRQWGERATWADNYINSADEIVFGTRPTLPNAHNVDVTNLRPGGAAGGDDGHQWPHEFYTATMNGALPAAEEWGYPLSREAGYGLPGAWSPLDEYANGQSPVVLPRDTVPILDAVPSLRTTVIAHTPYDFEALGTATSDTGTVQLAGTSLSMTTGSPVWLAAAVDVLDPVNFLSFEFEFTSDSLSEGLFGVYWDDELLGTLDERFIPAGSHEFTFGLTEEEATLGTHVLAFRLDPYTDAASSVYLINVHTGYVAVVPEPPTLAIACIGASVVVVVRLRRKRFPKLRQRSRH